MQISNTQPKQVTTKAPQKPSTDNSKADKSASEGGSVLRDVVAFGAGATAGVAGGIYGGVEGLVKGSIENFPKHVKAGANIGSKILTPIGGAVGAIATGVIATGAAVGAPIVAGLSIGVGFVGGTAVSAIKNAPSTIAAGAKQGAATGAKAGSGLGAVGRFVGTAVGGLAGGIAGAVVSIAKGFPDGVSLAKSEAIAGKELITSLPQFTKDTWNIAYKGGRGVAGGIGSLAGGTVGLTSAAGETAIDGAANAIKRGAQWGTNASNFVKGNKAEPPKQQGSQA